MGISGLLQFIKDAAEPVNVKKYRGQTVAVDTYCWLHKGAFSCAEKLAKGEPTDQYVWYCMKFVDMLLNFGVKPILVFDGQNLPSKREVERSRRERRELNLQKGKQLLREGKLSEARDCFNRCVNITPAMAHNLIKIARSRGVDCVVAPYEADAQLAFLSKSGLAQAVITEDSDLLAFGCKNVILKMDKQGNGLEIAQSHLGRVKSLGNVFTEEKFRHMCILSGCDYLPSLHGIGLGKACRLLRLARDPDILKVIKKMGQYLKMDLVVPDSYLEGFVRANNTFLYQLVFDPRSRRVVPLNPYPENIQPQELSYAGLHIGDEKGLQMALGNLDLNSLEIIDNYNPDAPHAQPTKPRSRSWKDSPSSLPSSSSSIWSRGYSTALPTSTSDPSPSSPPSPSAESRGSTRGQQRVVSVAPLKLPCIKRPREDSLSDQDMLLQYSSNDQKRSRSEPPSSLPPLSFSSSSSSSSSFSSTKPQAPLRTRNRFATLLQRRNQDSEEEGLATCSRFFSSPAPASNPKSSSPPAQSLFPSEAQDSEAPEAPSVDTPSPSPPASSPNTPQNTTTDTTTTDTDTTAVYPPAHSPSSNKGLQLFHWSGSHTEQTSCGLSTLKRFRFKKENGTRPHSPVKHRAGEDPEELSDSPPSQDNGYFSQSQSSIPSTSSSLSSDTQGLLCSRLIDLDKDSDADLSPTDRKPNTPTYKAAGLSRPNPTQTLKPRALGPARVSGLKRKSSSSKANLNNENSPGVQATISGLWKNFGFTKDSPKISHKEPLSPVKDNVVS